MSYTAALILTIAATYPAVGIPLMVYDYIQMKRWKRKVQS